MRKLSLLLSIACAALAMPVATSATERIDAPAADYVKTTSTAAALPRQATPIGALGDRPADGSLDETSSYTMAADGGDRSANLT